MDLGISMRPLIGLQVWLYCRERGNAWVQAVAPRVVEAGPEGLYVNWAELKEQDAADVIIRNPAFSAWPDWLDPYEMVRLTPVPDALAQFNRLEKMAAEMPATPKAAEPVEKPWWED